MNSLNRNCLVVFQVLTCCILAILISWMIFSYDNCTKLKEFQATKQALEIIRENNKHLEATTIDKIVECNQWLSEMQNKKSFKNCFLYNKIFIPNEVDNLKPIE